MADVDISSISFGDTTYNLKDPTKIPISNKGAPLGVAELDSSGKVPSSQLPSMNAYRTAANQDTIDAAQNTAINSKSTIEVWRLN